MRRLFGGLIIAFAAARAVAAPAVQPVEATAVASTARVEPGKPFDVGVVLRMQPGWHVYWLNPGDSGLPTSVRWTAPEGYRIGPLAWPVPRRFQQPGGVVGYGYDDVVLLRATVTPPAAVPDATAVALRAEVGWLACERLCIRGKKSLELDRRRRRGRGRSRALHAVGSTLPDRGGRRRRPRDAHARGAVPADGSVGDVTVTVDWKRGTRERRVVPTRRPGA